LLPKALGHAKGIQKTTLYLAYPDICKPCYFKQSTCYTYSHFHDKVLNIYMYYVSIFTLFHSSKLHTLKNEPLSSQHIHCYMYFQCVFYGPSFLSESVRVYTFTTQFGLSDWGCSCKLRLITATPRVQTASDWHFHYTCNIDILLLLPLFIWYIRPFK